MNNTTFDASMCRNFLTHVHEADAVLELRIPNTRRGTVAGYFNDVETAVKAVGAWNGKAPGIYCTLNPVNPVLLARANNRLREYVPRDEGTDDSDILHRRFLPIDFDPKRPKGISSTDTEHESALERARACREWLMGQGWPMPILANSGNGSHLLYRLDLPNDEDVRSLVENCLKAIAVRFSDTAVIVDTGIFNASRLWKVYGTLACKGDPMPDRPHRLAHILEAPDKLEVVPWK